MNSSPAHTSDARPKWQRVLLAIAAAGFFAGIYLSIRAQPELLSQLDYRPLVILALLGVPITIFLNAEEFRASGRLLGHEFSRETAAEITIVASVANMLPIPGGTIVRVAALRARGSRLRESTAATFLVFFLWIGIAFAFAGAWLVSPAISGEGRPGLIVLFLGATILIVALVAGWRMFGHRRALAALILVKSGLVLMDAVRIYLCFLVLDADGSFAQASVLTMSSVAGAAVSIVPAGLGIREATAALLAPGIALTAATAYLATSLNRVVGLAIMAPLALYLSVRLKAESGR